MVEPVTLLLGPLVGPECRRAVGRGWLIWVRMLLGLAAVGTALACIWWWWASQALDIGFSPAWTFRFGLDAIERIGVTLALVMAPALLAGSLAGEKERGSMGLLLTTRVNSVEIVLGRVAGKVSQIAMILLAGVPGLVLIAALAGIGPRTGLVLFFLPVAVGIGSAGISAAASVVARRGRDALLVVYLIEMLLIVVPLIVVSLTTGAWIGTLSPFHGIDALSWEEQATPALVTMAVWCAFGLSALAVACWRLRPVCLHLLGGDARGRRSRRQLRVPSVSEKRPMLWKELYIERVGSVGRAGTVIGACIILYLFIVSTVLGGLIVWHLLVHPDPASVDANTARLDFWIGDQAWAVAVLIQLAIGLRAAVAISSERERGTWDALLTSPLQGQEIVRGKLWGNLFALRWLFVAAFWAWSIALMFGAMRVGRYFKTIGDILAAGAFISAVGTRISLAAPTATRAMAITMGCWLAGWGLVKILAAIGAGILAGLAAGVWQLAIEYGLTTQTNAVIAAVGVFIYAYPAMELVAFVVATVIVLAESRLRFDRIAGRMTEGEAAIAVDRALHGTALAPVLLDGPSNSAAAVDSDENGQTAHADRPAGVNVDSA